MSLAFPFPFPPNPPPPSPPSPTRFEQHPGHPLAPKDLPPHTPTSRERSASTSTPPRPSPPTSPPTTEQPSASEESALERERRAFEAARQLPPGIEVPPGFNRLAQQGVGVGVQVREPNCGRTGSIVEFCQSNAALHYIRSISALPISCGGTTGEPNAGRGAVHQTELVPLIVACPARRVDRPAERRARCAFLPRSLCVLRPWPMSGGSGEQRGNYRQRALGLATGQRGWWITTGITIAENGRGEA